MAVENSEKTRPVGHDLRRFVTAPPDALICQICQRVAKEPHQVTCCGKVCCRVCVSLSVACPNCNLPTRNSFDSRSDRQLKRLKVSCKNGCPWTGALDDLESHARQCPLAELPCPNNCGEKVWRCDVEDHKKYKCPNRSYTCSICNKTGPHKMMVESHEQQCPDTKIACPNRCETTVLRRYLEAHRAVCPKEQIECPYAGVGCTERPLREDQQKHVTECAAEHARLALQSFYLRSAQLSQMKDLLSRTQSATAPITLKMADYLRHQTHCQHWNSLPFFTRVGGYKLRLCVNANGYRDGNGTHMSVFLFLAKGQHDGDLPWPFRNCVTIQLLNQLRDENHFGFVVNFKKAPKKACERVMDEDWNTTGYGLTKFISLAELAYNAEKGTQYLMDDCLYFRVSVTQDKPWLTQSIC